MNRWGGIDWLEDSIHDRLPSVAECDYFSVPYDQGSATLVESPYVIMLSTWDTPADDQLEAVRDVAAQTAGEEAEDVEVGGAAGLRFVDPSELFCQLIIRTSDTSTLLVLVADPDAEMGDDCAVAEGVLAGLLTQG